MDHNKQIRIYIPLYFALTTLLSCAAEEQEQVPIVQGIEHIVVIGVDGMSPDGIKNSNSPNINQLINAGTVYHAWASRASNNKQS